MQLRTQDYAKQFDMKIAFDSQIFSVQEYGGISRYICSLANSLSHHPGIEPKIFAPMYVNAYLTDLPSKLVFGQKIPRILKISRLFHAVNKTLARPAMRQFRPDVVHETYYSTYAYAPTFARRVLTIYDMIDERFSEMIPKYDPISKYKRVAVLRADHIICISENTRKDLLELFDLAEDKVSVVYLGFDSLTPEIPEANKKRPYLLYVGARGGYKNFECFLRAYASSSWLCNNFDVVCFGGGEFSSDEKKLFDIYNFLIIS
jgi:glycosyltransferase involved in cell wall biosynthesis